MENKLGYDEFNDVFFEEISTLITNEEHIEQNELFYQEVSYKLFELYQKESSGYTVSELLKMFHIFLYSMFLHKPSVEKPEDAIRLNY